MSQESLGFVSPSMPAWDVARLAGEHRHHLRRPLEVEEVFWSAFERGASLPDAARLAGVGRTTGYRWLQRRFLRLREDRVSLRAAASSLRVDTDQSARWEVQRQRALVGAARADRSAQHDAVLTSAGMRRRCCSRGPGRRRSCDTRGTGS